ncbi:olfactory receptor 4F15-like [Moschus berezovskii]|uniref:olfactory receptor 4F15-like n=1 Tax=Moschus berezovskii TaxID=68408 RepID=UPI002443A075|nr:olfactory receptor 4F15-like [Moschus berezovskii]
MCKANDTSVSEFVFLGLSTSRPVQHFLLAFSTVFYVIIVLWKSLVVLTVTFDPHLHSPLYFLLANLSFIDLCFSAITVPKMISDLNFGHKTISFQGCVTQIFVLHTLGGSEMVLLTATALDRYVAICQPLHYLTIMSPRVCLLLVCGAWAIGLIHSVVQLAFVIHLPFCGPSEIDSFYCDLPWFIKLACIDSYKMEFMVTANSGFISMGNFFLLIISYVFILVTVWKRSSGGLRKALSTLSAHITVVVLFFGPCIFVYMWPFPTVPVDKFLAILDFLVTPILNPAIYTLRNKDMKMAMR